MQLKPNAIQIDAGNPFENDLLDRFKCAEMLTTLLASIAEPLVLSIDAPWGAGKTTFLAMWRQHLKNSGFATLHFNAWENDFTNDALVSLIGELGAGLENLVGEKQSRSSAGDIFKKIKKVGASLVKMSVPVAVKIATAGALDLDKFSEQALANFAERMAQEQIEKYEISKGSIAAFREHLGDFVLTLTSASNEGEKKPLILIIDELDRCRPTYAIEVLEKAKHFFNVDGIVFVLAIDKGQICHSIKSVYGLGMDVEGYLKRFIDLEYTLPQPVKGAFCKGLFERFSLDQYFVSRSGPQTSRDRELFLSIFTELFHVFNFSLREQEQCFTQLSIALGTTPENMLIFPELLGFLIALKAKNLDLYKEFAYEKAGPEEVLEYVLGMPGGDAFFDEYRGIALTAYLFTCRSDMKFQDLAAPKYEAYIGEGELSEKEAVRKTKVLDFIERLAFDRYTGILPYLATKIDLVSSFSV
jgi:hypothetical protein